MPKEHPSPRTLDPSPTGLELVLEAFWIVLEASLGRRLSGKLLLEASLDRRLSGEASLVLFNLTSMEIPFGFSIIRDYTGFQLYT